MIVRGTTPYHTFIVPMASETISEVYITYLQNNEVVLDKSTTDVVIEDVELELENADIEDTEGTDENEDETGVVAQITLHLTQEDTLKFKFFPAAEKNIAVVQLRILDTDGEAYASDPVHERIFGVLKEGVIPPNETDANL